jgi:hypothetical protein
MPQPTRVTHLPAEQPSPLAQVPQVPPQPSSPHTLSLQLREQHWPVERQTLPEPQPQSAGQFAQFSPAWQPFAPHKTASMHRPF